MLADLVPLYYTRDDIRTTVDSLMCSSPYYTNYLNKKPTYVPLMSTGLFKMGVFATVRYACLLRVGATTGISNVVTCSDMQGYLRC